MAVEIIWSQIIARFFFVSFLDKDDLRQLFQLKLGPNYFDTFQKCVATQQTAAKK